MTQNPRILIADDDSILTDMLSEYLEEEGFAVECTATGLETVQAVAHDTPDLVVLDIMMPELSGIEALKEIRRHTDIPVIMLTARGDDLDRILGLELGADDYLGKPCNPRELLARIRAVLRRSGGSISPPDRGLVLGDLGLYPGTRRTTVMGNDVCLTQTEFDLLYLLLSTPDQVVTKADMSLNVLDKPISQWDRSIDVHISNLRRKIGLHEDGSERIRTLRGSGYLYVSQAQAP